MALPNDSILVTPGSGATVATQLVSAKEYQVVMVAMPDGNIQGSLAQYRLICPAQAVGASKVFLDFFNATGSGVAVRVLSAYCYVDNDTAVTGTLGVEVNLTRTTAVGTGGTAATTNGTALNAITLSTMDTANAALSANITARSAPGGGATAGALIGQRWVFTEETSAPSGIAGTTTKFGELAGIGTGMAQGHGFSQSFTEHGVIIGLVSIRGYLTYQQGNERMWNRRTQFDFYWPGLAHLPEQAILSQEIYADGSTDDVDVFGYQERWAEYKYKPSRTSGFFRSTDPTPLDMWHLGEKFASRPVLNTVFITEPPPVDRVLQVATNFGEQFLFDSLFDVRYVRCMPMFSVPGLGSRL